MNWRIRISFTFVTFFTAFLLAVSADISASAEQQSPLMKGIADYNAGNYEEALVGLTNVYKAAPSSAKAAYYLGLAYRESLNYDEARTYLEKALELRPFMTETLVPLAEVLCGLGLYGEAEKRLKEVQGAAIASARASYVRGIVYMKTSRLEDAKSAFRRAVKLEPGSEAAALAREALASISGKESIFSLSLGYSFQYDDNVILKPSEDVSGIPIDEADTRHVFRLGGDYSTEIGGMGLKAAYRFYQSLHQDLDYMDLQGHSLIVTPSFDAGGGRGNLPLSYNHYSLDGEKYLKSYTLRPSYIFTTEKGNGVSIFAGVTEKEFFADPASPEEERDASNMEAGLDILIPYREQGYVKIGYAYDRDDADGDNWDYSGHRGGVTLLHPFTSRTELEISGSYYIQDYSEEHSSFGDKRSDRIASASLMVRHNYKGMVFSATYSYSAADSNITFYDYDRNIAGIGVEATF